MPRRIINAPNTYHTFERLASEPDQNPAELPVVFIGPHKQVFDPFDDAGQPIDDALLGSYSWPEGSKNVFAAKAVGMEYSQYDVPGVEPGAVVQELDVWAVLSAGANPTKLRSSEDETVIASVLSATGTLTPASGLNGVDFVLTDASVNFYRAFQRFSNIVYPANNAQLSQGGWVMVRLSGVTGGPFYVASAPTSTNPYQLVLKGLGYNPIYAARSVQYSVVHDPAEFSLVTGQAAARAECAALTRLETANFTHLKLAQPGTYQFTAGGGHVGALVLTAEAVASLLDEQLVTLITAGAVTRIMGIDVVGDGVAGSDFVADVSGDVTDAEVAVTIAAAIVADGFFDAIVHPVYDDRVIVRQKTAGVAGNTAATQTTAVGFHDFFVNAPAGATVADSAFAGGSAAAGTTFYFKNVSDKAVRIKLNTPAGAAATPHPGWFVNGSDEYETTGSAGFTLAANTGLSVFELNALLATEAGGGPRVFIEPASLDTWDDAGNVSPNPSASMSQLIVGAGIDPSAANLSGGLEPVGEILIPAGEVRQFPVTYRQIEAFRTTDTIYAEMTGNDRGAVVATVSAPGVWDLEIPTDDGTVPIGRNVGSTADGLHTTALSVLNAAFQTYLQTTRGLEHAPDDLVRLVAHPDDQGWLVDDATDWYVLPNLASLGIDGGGAQTLPSVYYSNVGSIEPTAGVTHTSFSSTGQPISHVVEFEYRTEGSAGNGLNIGFLWRANGGVTALGITNAFGELLITLGSNAKGVLTAETWNDIAVALDEQNPDDTYVYPVKVSRIWNASTGAEVDPVDDTYSGWNAIPVSPFTFREISDFTTTGGEDQKSRLYTGERQDTIGGFDVAVARIDETLIGKGSLGTISLYADYVALRNDSSPVATLGVHGRTPDLVRVRYEDLDTVIGPKSLQNEMRVIFDEYFATAQRKTAYFIGVDEVTADDPWGTEEALDRAFDLVLRRDGYHIAIMNPADWVLPWAVAKAESLGGEVTTLQSGDKVVSFLKKSLYLYLPEEIPEVAPDKTLLSGTEVELVSEVGTTTVVNTNGNMVLSEIAAGDIFISTEFPAAGPVETQDGLKGWRISAIDNANPSRLILSGTGITPVIYSTPGDPQPWTIIRPGASLRNTDGSYKAEEAKDAMLDFHDREGYYHALVLKHPVNQYDHPYNGTLTTLDGTYLLAQFMGIVARTEDWVPASGAEYSAEIRNLKSSLSFFNEEQLAQLAGVGLTWPYQKVSPAGRTRVWRDVSSDTSTRTLTRRTARVSEHKLVRQIDQLVRPKLAQQLVDQQFLDLLTADVDSIMIYFRDRQIFKKLQVETILPIDDAIRAEYGLDDTGVLVIWSYIHREEAGAVINRHKVAND